MVKSIKQADKEFRNRVKKEKQMWDEINNLIEDVELEETNKNAFLRLTTMLERVRNTDIYLNYWSMAAIGRQQKELQITLRQNYAEKENIAPEIFGPEPKSAVDDYGLNFPENKQNSEKNVQALKKPSAYLLTILKEKPEIPPAEPEPVFPPAEANQKDLQLISEFINRRGTDELPYLITILENGKNPRFCLNVNGSVRSCRQDYASPNTLEVVLACTKGKGKKKCYGRHRLKVKTRKMITKEPVRRYGKTEHELDTSRPDLIYDRNNYTVMSNYYAPHSCCPIAFRTVKMIKQGQAKIKSLCYESGKSMAAERKYKISDMVKCEIIDPQAPSPTTVTNAENKKAAENLKLPECPNAPDFVANQTMTINEVNETESEIEDMQT